MKTLVLHMLLLAIAFTGLSFAQEYEPERDIRTSAEYYPQNGQLMEKFEYYFDFWAEQETRHGKLTRWSQKGTKQYETYYQNGLLYGPEYIYRKSGRLQEIHHWVNGKRFGESRYFFRNGKIRFSQEYRNEIPNGLKVIYSRKGTIKKKVYYKNGEKHGSYIVWNKKGEIVLEREFENGSIKRDGLVTSKTANQDE